MSFPSAAAPALELHDVACARGSNLLFRGVSLRLLPGQMLRVRGANGCGKSSLLRVICGLLPAAQGQVLWRGQPMRGGEGEANDLLYLGHAHGLREELSARENLEFAASLGGDRLSQPVITQALTQAGLRASADVPLRRLSQGQRRRCALARLPLARRQRLWVLDEPFNALDADGTDWLMGEMRGHLLREGLVVFTSHQSLPIDTAADLELAL